MNWKPYTYLLKCPNGLFYYGVKYANNKRDIANPTTFWIEYFTSSESIKSLRETYSDSEFEFEIRKTFDNAEDVIKWESKVNRRFTTKSTKFLNDSYMDGRNQSGENNGMFGKFQRSESTRKMVETRRKNNNGEYGGKRLDYSYLTDEYRKMLSDNAKKQAKEGRIFKLFGEEIFKEYDKFIFPTDSEAYKTTGARASKASYFAKWYVSQFPEVYQKSKNPVAAIASRIKARYGK